MPADERARRTRRRLVALVAIAVLLALTAFSWWLSGRWLARPERRPETRRSARRAAAPDDRRQPSGRALSRPAVREAAAGRHTFTGIYPR